MPALLGEAGAHLKTPTPEKIERREIVFDQFVAPFAKDVHIFRHIVQSFRNRGIHNDEIALRAATGRRETPRLCFLFYRERGPSPDARADSEISHFCSKAGHVRVGTVCLSSRTGAVTRGVPTHVDDAEGAVCDTWRNEFRQKFSIAHAGLCGSVVPIHVIPIVTAVDGFYGNERALAHRSAKSGRHVEAGFAGLSSAHDDDGSEQTAAAQ